MNTLFNIEQLNTYILDNLLWLLTYSPSDEVELTNYTKEEIIQHLPSLRNWGNLPVTPNTFVHASNRFTIEPKEDKYFMVKLEQCEEPDDIPF